MPSNTGYRQIWGVALLGGIGFTMSIFTCTLAYTDTSMQVTSKVAIIAGSVIASCMGYVFLNKHKPSFKLYKQK
jgi:NhaA family Na+:H+ antiporter